VTLSCHADDHGGVIEIEDECGGLTEHESARLSSTFAARPIGQLRGQGLALAQRDVEAMAGRISLKNQPNHGCTFRLTFPPAQPPRSMPWQQRDAG
jgi:signal transduction histidine kinase